MPFNITPEFVQGLLDQLQQSNEQNQALTSQIETLTKFVQGLLNQLKQANEQNEALTKLVEELRQTIKELEARLNKNPRNSSKPPSSEGYEKPNPKSNREPSGKKPGGQDGHKGHGLKKIQADRIEEVTHIPDQCHGCPFEGECECVCTSPVRHEYDVEITIVDRQHKTASFVCQKNNGEVLSGQFPDGISSSQQYGDGIKSLAASLNTEGMMSVDRIHNLMSAVFLIPCSTGFISSAITELAEKLRPAVEGIFDSLLGSPVVNCDETGFRTDGKLYWVHSVCNGFFTYLAVHNKRGEEAMRAIGFLPNYYGTAVHDCWSPYWHFGQLTHGLCNEHILRELKGHQESNPEQEWIPGFRKLLQDMDHYKNETLAKGAEMEPITVDGYLNQYDELLKTAVETNPIPERKPGQRGKVAKGKLRSLIDRLVEHKGEFCLFIKDLKVPFTNNLAEQSVRMLKVKIKVSGCMRTVSGAENFATIMSYIETVKKHGINVFDAIRMAFKGESYQLLFPTTE